MKTKDEILDAVIPDASDNFDTNYRHEVLDAMFQYAKQQAIDFIHWTLYNQWEYLYWGGDRGEGWHCDRDYSSPSISDEQLYDLYLKDKNNDKLV